MAPGDEFVAPYSGPGQAGPMILDPRGGVVWFKPLPPASRRPTCAVQQYAGKPVLTWWQGDVSVHGFGLGEGVIADQSYTDIAHVRAGNGLQADLHEFQLTPQGTALITAYEPIYCDLAADGGKRRRRGDGRRLPGDRRSHRPGHDAVDEPRPRRAGRIL